MIQDGLLSAVRVGRRVRVTRADLDRTIASGYSASRGTAEDGLADGVAFWEGGELPEPQRGPDWRP